MTTKPDHMDDYDTLNRRALRQRLVSRNTRHSHLKRKPQLIAALRKSDRKHEKHMKEVRAAEERKLAKDKIWCSLFQREFRADSNKMSFLDLPREIRDICYEFTFRASRKAKNTADLEATTGNSHLSREIDYDSRSDRFKARYESWKNDNFSLSTRALVILGTMSKFIREEARTTCWSLTNFSLSPTVRHHENLHDWPHCEPHYIAVFERYMRGIGTDGRSKMKVLKLLPTWYFPDDVSDMDYNETVYTRFAQISNMLTECHSLTTFFITIPASYLFRGDETALDGFLIHDQPLKSKGIESFQNVLQALPRLRHANINLPLSHTSWKQRPTSFHSLVPVLRHALTRRGFEVLSASKAIFESTKLHQTNGQIHVPISIVYAFQGVFAKLRGKKD